MSDSTSVSQWVADLKQGDEKAAALLWDRYFQQMVRAAREKLGPHPLAIADEEDIALSAFDSLCRGAAKGNFGKLSDRRDLWSLLLTITSRKAIDRIRWENRQRRGGTKASHEKAADLDDLFATGPTPELIALMNEQYSVLLSRLRDDTLRNIVRWKLEGHTNEEIGEFLGVSVHTVGRKLRMIRLAWSQELAAS